MENPVSPVLLQPSQPPVIPNSPVNLSLVSSPSPSDGVQEEASNDGPREHIETVAQDMATSVGEESGQSASGVERLSELIDPPPQGPESLSSMAPGSIHPSEPMPALASNATETSPATTTGVAVTSESIPAQDPVGPPPMSQTSEHISETGVPPVDSEPPIPSLPPAPERSKRDVPDWVNIQEDTSSPDQDELNEIEGSVTDISALDTTHYESMFFPDVDDPEQKPVKKIRLSWTFKGVRGTRDDPNLNRVMHSPAVCINGFHWHIKFYPRGNNSTSLSAYIKCSRRPPKKGAELGDGQWAVYQGSPEANLGRMEPEKHQIQRDKVESSDSDNSQVKEGVVHHAESKTRPHESTPRLPGDSSDTRDQTMTDQQISFSSEVEDWRMSAQLGMTIYNPAEPRTCTWMSSAHQFNKHNDDWGWGNFPVPWNEIHVRRRGQRQALLRNDTLAIDAYIRVFDDPTQALWWHPADTEAQWDSKSLTGYFPMGTPPLYHSPAVAGITALLLLAPFRKVLQRIDTSLWRKSSQVKPQPLISSLQQVLFLMRNMRKSEYYVNVNQVLHTLEAFGEDYSDVKTFWEAFRRSIELELDGNQSALNQIRSIFDIESDGDQNSTIELPLKIPVEGTRDVQAGIERVLAVEKKKLSFPDFLPILLDRQKFDEKTREWKVLYDRVILSEELDLSRYVSTTNAAKYTLYGFMVHSGDRTSTKFYSVLRPNGPGSKWLAFEDGDGNKVFSYTKRRIQQFEGLEGENPRTLDSSPPIAYIVMYIRSDKLDTYLTGALEPYDMSQWLKLHLPSRWEGDESIELPIETDKIQVYRSDSLVGRVGLLDLFNLKDVENHEAYFHELTIPSQSTFTDVRLRLAEHFKVDRTERICLWTINYTGLGNYMVAAMNQTTLRKKVEDKITPTYPGCLWMAILENEEDIIAYGEPDPGPQPIDHELQGISGNEATHAVDETRSPELATSGGAGNAPTDLSTDSASDTGGQVNVDNTEPANQDTREQTQSLQSVAASRQASTDNTSDQNHAVQQPVQVIVSELSESTASPLPVEHGHLVDAVRVPDRLDPSNQSFALPDTTPSETVESQNADAATDALIAAIVTSDVRHAGFRNILDAVTAVDTAEPPRSELPPNLFNSTTDTPHTERSRSSSMSSTDVAATPSRVAINPCYGFIQMFDVEKQNFVMKKEFFADRSGDVNTTIAKSLCYSKEREFLVWQRVKVYNTSRIVAGTTFSDIKFCDGAVIIVGDVLSEEKKDELLARGQFVTPDSLVRVLFMAARKHPTFSFTGHKTLLDFGGSYYSGPMVSGRYHGAEGTLISSNGHKYTGPFVADEKSGPNGTMTYQNGDLYTGTWLKDEKDGHGTFVEKRTGNKYEGGFQNGKRWGQGVTYWQVADEQRDLCQICYTEEVDALFYECGHVCACVECAKQCDSCPICRKDIGKVVKMYRS